MGTRQSSHDRNQRLSRQRKHTAAPIRTPTRGRRECRGGREVDTTVQCASPRAPSRSPPVRCTPGGGAGSAVRGVRRTTRVTRATRVHRAKPDNARRWNIKGDVHRIFLLYISPTRAKRSTLSRAAACSGERSSLMSCILLSRDATRLAHTRLLTWPLTP